MSSDMSLPKSQGVTESRKKIVMHLFGYFLHSAKKRYHSKKEKEKTKQGNN
jgi:hypothetical protein